ncbi:hypothetical protein BHAOGJBA_5011 [Methylobacterium hispanicum]|jgi:hypothetical protein|uniref:Type III secretion system chaperone n=1 Tax=Methylobacterium hispanicum TaxID=270350 RepID=A0AAV4ZT41_9HYPH|nr:MULTISPECIES: type III secretion system chaperone [Methylobacterium]GJD91463.1 hypothetical protein BHAOGJBA_5011 [Methylobacterium hispanicum]
MQSVDEALEAIRVLAGLPRLALDGDGQVELIFDKTIRVAIAKIDAGSFELYTELPGLGQDLDRDVLVRLMTANYLGEATGPGRLMLDPRDRVVCYGQRVEVGPLDAAQLEATLLGFMKYVAFLRSEDAAALIRGPREAEAAAPAGDLMIRI